MAEHKSRLVLEIDSRDAEQKAADVRKALGALEDAGVRVKPVMDKAGAGIDGVGKTASKAGESLGQLGKSADGSAKSTTSSSESYAEASARLLAMATNSLQASDYVKSLTASTSAASVSFDAASDKVRSLSSLAARLRAESDALAGSTDKAAASTRQSSVATDLQAKELSELLGKINPTVAALGRLDDMHSKLGQFHKAGLLDTETFKDYSTRLDSTRKGLSAFDDGLSKTGISAKQTEAALRQLPMQFTDIFTSLAAGQSPLLVLLQQGGQIKDSFGGIGNTVDVLGGKVKGFFSSIVGSSGGVAGAGAALGELASQQEAVAEGSEAAADGLGGMAEGANTAADASKNAKEAAEALGVGLNGAVLGGIALVAAAAALGVVFYDAEKEISAFNKALFSGTASSGQTAASLAAISKTVSALTGDISEANAAVIALAGSAQLSTTQFVNLAQASASIAEFSGASALDVAKALGDVGDSATTAAQKISSQYGLITSAQYAVIAALDEQGKKQEALDALSGFLNENAQNRLRKYRDSLSDIERDWNDIGAAISNAYSMVRSELFPDLQKEADIIERILKTRRDGGFAGALSTGLGKVSSTFGSALGMTDRDSTSALEAQLALIKQRLTLNQQTATAEGAANQADQERIEKQKEWAALVKSNYTVQKKLANDIAKARELGAQAGKSQLEIDRQVAAIQSRFDKKPVAGRSYTEDAGQKMLDEARQRFAVLQQQGRAITDQTNGTAALGTEAKKLIELETMLANLKTKGTLTASQKQLLAMGELNVAQQRLNAGLEEQNKLASVQVQNAAKLKAYQDNLTSRLDSSQEELNSRLAGAGLGGEAKSRLQEDLKIQQDYQKRLNKLTNDYNSGDDKSPGRTKLYDDEVALEKAALDKRIEQQKGYYANLDALRGNWLAGSSTAWQSYLEIATNYNQQTQDATAQLLGDTTSSISDQIQGLVKGTTSLGDAFGNLAGTMSGSVLQALSDIAAKWVVVQALKMAGIDLEMKKTVAAEGTKTAAKLTTDAVSTSSTLAAIATTLAANVSAAATTIASWLPAALVASIGSFGAAAVVGGGALVAAYALLKGFSSGGYTGAGGVNEPAGMVHKGEVVWSQADISRFGGVAAVESLRKGNVTPIGAARTGSSSSGAQSSGSGDSSGMNVSVHNYAGAQVETQRDGDQMKIIIKQAKREIARDLAQGNGEVTRALTSGYGLRRAAR